MKEYPAEPRELFIHEKASNTLMASSSQSSKLGIAHLLFADSFDSITYHHFRMVTHVSVRFVSRFPAFGTCLTSVQPFPVLRQLCYVLVAIEKA